MGNLKVNKSKQINKKSKQKNVRKKEFKIPKIFTNTWVISGLVVLIFFIILPQFLVHPTPMVKEMPLHQSIWNITPGIYTYKVIISNKTFADIKNKTKQYMLQKQAGIQNQNLSYNLSALNKLNNTIYMTFNINKYKDYYIIHYNNTDSNTDSLSGINTSTLYSNDYVVLDRYGHEQNTNISNNLILTKIRYNFIFAPWFTAINGSHWHWQREEYLDLGYDKILQSTIKINVLSQTTYKNRTAYVAELSDGRTKILYYIDAIDRIILKSKTDSYITELVSAPFLH